MVQISPAIYLGFHIPDIIYICTHERVDVSQPLKLIIIWRGAVEAAPAEGVVIPWVVSH